MGCGQSKQNENTKTVSRKPLTQQEIKRSISTDSKDSGIEVANLYEGETKFFDNNQHFSKQKVKQNSGGKLETYITV